MEFTTSREMKKYLLDHPFISYWLKDAIRAVHVRDALDAYNDAELLFEYCKLYLNEVENGLN